MKMSKMIKLAVFVTFLFTFKAHAEVAVIVHPSNVSPLDVSAISKIYLGKSRTFPSGDEAIPVDLEQGSATRIEFIQTILSKSESQMKAYWARLVFSGKGSQPRALSSDADVITLVAKNPSVIGYVDAGSVNDSVKVVHKF